MDALRARFSAVGATVCTFFPAWFSCFGPAAMVNPEAAETVEGLQLAWKIYADQTNEQKADRASRLDPPRVPASFRPHGIVGPNCAKDDGRHGPRQFCPDCMAARRRFVGDVQAAGELFDGALYDHRWRRAAWELQRRPTTAAVAAAAAAAAAEPEPEPEPEPEVAADLGRTHLIEAAAGADTTSFASGVDFVGRAVDSGCAIA